MRKSFWHTWAGRLMLWRRTNFSFSAKIGRSQRLHSELKDGTSGEANPAAMPVDLICSGTDGLLFGKKTRSAFFSRVFSPLASELDLPQQLQKSKDADLSRQASS